MDAIVDGKIKKLWDCDSIYSPKPLREDKVLAVMSSRGGLHFEIPQRSAIYKDQAGIESLVYLSNLRIR